MLPLAAPVLVSHRLGSEAREKRRHKSCTKSHLHEDNHKSRGAKVWTAQTLRISKKKHGKLYEALKGMFHIVLSQRNSSVGILQRIGN